MIRKADEARQAVEQLAEVADGALLGYRHGDGHRQLFWWKGLEREAELLHEVEEFLERADAAIYGVMWWKCRVGGSGARGVHFDLCSQVFPPLAGRLREQAERAIDATLREWNDRVQRAVDAALEGIRRDPFPAG